METMTRGAVRQPGPTLSHEERDTCLHALGALHASGKLSLSELDARIKAALAATTHDELAALVRESSRTEVALRPPEPEPEEPPVTVAAAAHPPRRTGGWLFALRVVVFVALSLLLALARVLTLLVVAVCVVLLRALVVAARGGWAGCQALVQWSTTGLSSVRRTQPSAVPARLQLRRAPSRELVLAPRAQVPAQRQPTKVHPVIVPSEADASSTSVVIASRSAAVVPVRRPVVRGDVLTRDLASLASALRREDRRLRELVSQLRPLVHRVADRARRRRMTTTACERAAHSKGWRRAIQGSRTTV